MRSFLYHEIRYSFRTSGGSGTALSVFTLALVLFPLLMGPETDILQRVGPGLIWLMAGLASLLYAPALIQEDLDDGSLTQMLLVPIPSIQLFIFKALTHFLLVGVPLILMSFLATPLYGLSLYQTEILVTTLLLGLPAISILSLVGSALCAGAQGSTLLIMLLILPLMVPLFIFGLSAVDAANLGLPIRPHLLLLGGVSLLGMILGTVAGQSLLKGLG